MGATGGYETEGPKDNDRLGLGLWSQRRLVSRQITTEKPPLRDSQSLSAPSHSNHHPYQTNTTSSRLYFLATLFFLPPSISISLLSPRLPCTPSPTTLPPCTA